MLARGRVRVLEGERVAGAIGRMLERFHVTSGVRVRVASANCEDGPMLVQANLRIAGNAARMQSLTGGHSNIFPAVSRLEHQIRCLSGPWRPRAWPEDTRRPLTLPGRNPIARRKAVPLRTLDPLAAVQLMDAMDYDVHLFVDAETGEDAIVYRAGPSGLKLARQHHVNPPDSQPDSERLTISPVPAPVSAEADAVHRLCDHGLPFLFYTDRDTGRGHLLYRRYDADLTLVTPATDRASRP
ncbi:sigma 54 modulation/S30EA ribosomal C-terminal domain-containing protein [Nocardia terrae]|uniref:sigma 54 modulation/S30EA ribosomal C-terminal domain-containing protein n=1 Tax=Nocardia terrae TaxID=2675851 RepID=UPI002E263F31